jgi:HPt (histidine-containing phosphotransfer) domain-containing protein
MLAGILLADLPPFCVAAQQFLERKDLTSLGRIAHKLKGTSGSLGAMDLHQACSDLDRVARNQDEAACAQAVPVVLQVVDRLRPILASFIETLPKC